MNELSLLPARPGPALDPVGDEPMDELHDKWVPVQEEELPQGVLDLLVALIRPHRSTLQAAPAPAWPSTGIAVGVGDAEGDEATPMASGVKPVAVPSAVLPVDQWGHPPVPQRLDPGLSIAGKITPSSMLFEPMPPDFSSDTQEPLAPGFDEPLPQAPASFPGMRHGQPVAPAVVAPTVLPPTLPLELMAETQPDPARGLLQVPFNKGTANGQVTISRTAEESIRNLTLNPSNAQVFEQLREPFAQAHEPAWRLVEHDAEQSRQDSRQGPDEEQDEQAEPSPWAD